MALRIVAFDFDDTTYPVPLSSDRTLTSTFIPYSFRINAVTVYFPLGCNGKVKVRIIQTTDNSVPAAGSRPAGENVLAQDNLGSETDVFLSGNDGYETVYLDREYNEDSVLKAYAVNSDTVAHTCSIKVYVEKI
tara:strand:+ start:5832 stop:6233 length:402 start_codon:yes stop_codon:yes gene_type:complete